MIIQSVKLQKHIQDKNLFVEIENKKATRWVTCDNYKIGQVLRNLLANTIKYSAVNQTIQIVLEETIIETIGRQTSAVKISVIDEGIGIPKNELSTIFEKFSQSSRTKSTAEGTGLGLAISKKIINAHGGKIWAANNQKGGATFSFLLPYQRDVVC